MKAVNTPLRRLAYILLYKKELVDRNPLVVLLLIRYVTTRITTK